jgi:hypothetical protein
MQLGMKCLGVAASALMVFAGSAHALPSLMDRIPSDALVSIVIPNPTALEASFKKAATSMGLPAGSEMNLEALMQVIGIADSVKADGPVGLAVKLPVRDKDGNELPEDQQNVVILVPVKDYAAFTKALGAEGDAEILTVNMGDGPAFARNIGDGYAALSKNKTFLTSFKGEKGQLAGHKARVSASADSVADRSDVVILVNVDTGRQVIMDGLKRSREEMENNMAMMGDGAPDMAPLNAMIDSFVEQSRSMVLGLKLDDAGISADMVSTFIEASNFAKIAGSSGKSVELMGRLPKTDYLIAGALDVSSEPIRNFLTSLPIPKQAGGDALQLADALKTMNGASFSLGFNPGGIMAGLLTRTVSFVSSPDPAAAVKQLQASMARMTEAKVANAKYTPAKTEVNGVKVDDFEIKMTANAEQPGAAQAMMFMFGPNGGPAGYVAQTNGGYIQTYSRSSELMGQALAAKPGSSLITDDQVKLVSSKLPEGRVAELYVGPKAIMNSITPVLTMFAGASPDYTPSDTIPPIGLAIAPGGGGLRATIFVPHASVRSISEYATSVQKAINPGEEPEEAPMGDKPAEKDDKKPSKPKF